MKKVVGWQGTEKTPGLCGGDARLGVRSLFRGVRGAIGELECDRFFVFCYCIVKELLQELLVNRLITKDDL